MNNDNVTPIDNKNVDEEIPVRIKWSSKWKKQSKEEIRKEVEKQILEQGIEDAPEDLIDEIVTDITKDVSKKSSAQKVKGLFRLSVLISASFSLLVFIILLLQVNDRFIPKEELQESLINALDKNVKLDDLKLVYQSESEPLSDSFWPILKPKFYYKKEDISLLSVLEDIKVKHLKSPDALSTENELLLTKVNEVIDQHNKVNPFDGLDNQSLKDFRSITDKLEPEQHKKIQDELLNLTASIKEKNRLIGQYLSSSNFSLYVSIAAFIFSILVTLWQFLPNRRLSQKQLIAEAIKEHMNKS